MDSRLRGNDNLEDAKSGFQMKFENVNLQVKIYIFVIKKIDTI